MISNPVSLFVTGNRTREFVYEGGSILYHFSPKDNKLSESMENNLIFFANDPDHARDVLQRMFEFVIDASLEYIENSVRVEDYGYGQIFHIISSCKRVNRFSTYLLQIDSIKLIDTPTNQFFKIGWASNDTIY